MSLFESASLVVTPNGTKASKLYAIKPTDGSGDLSVTRATTATRVNSAGLIESVASNVPRLDYTNGTCPSILVEPQRTNLLTYSEQFDNAAWNNVRGVVTANSTISPDGTTNSDTFASAAGQPFPPALTRTPSFTGNTNYSFSVFAKILGNSNLFNMAYVDNISGYTGGSVLYNLSTQSITITQSPNSSVTASIQNYGNGWYRLVINFLTIATPSFNYLQIGQSTNDVGNGFALYGAQLEAGAYATSYIPTTSASVTRNADVISKTGISSLIGQTEGVMYFDLKTIANNDFKRLSINGGSYVNSIFFDFDNTNTLYAKVFNGGSAVATLIASGINIANRNKIAIAYKNNDFSFYVNGSQVASQSSGSIPSGLANYEFSLASNQIFEGNINTAALWKTRLTNAELATLTTI